jgi:NNP family nitrate/nitrite transporter-like MFS transporter
MTHSAAHRNLLLATVAFAIAFALWGLLSGLAPIFKARYGLTATQTSLMVAIPVLLGSLGRIPLGVLTDRFGGRVVFSSVLLFGLVPPFALAADHSYASLLLWGFWLGVTGATFSVGVAHVSRWYPPERQGTALGIYGVGNIGQSLALVAGPFLAQLAGLAVTFRAFGLISFAWGLVFALGGRG